jgi:hypothetical protein
MMGGSGAGLGSGGGAGSGSSYGGALGIGDNDAMLGSGITIKPYQPAHLSTGHGDHASAAATNNHNPQLPHQHHQQQQLIGRGQSLSHLNQQHQQHQQHQPNHQQAAPTLGHTQDLVVGVRVPGRKRPPPVLNPLRRSDGASGGAAAEAAAAAASGRSAVEEGRVQTAQPSSRSSNHFSGSQTRATAHVTRQRRGGNAVGGASGGGLGGQSRVRSVQSTTSLRGPLSAVGVSAVILDGSASVIAIDPFAAATDHHGAGGKRVATSVPGQRRAAGRNN